MGNPLAQLLAMLQGNSLGMLPSQPQGVRPGFGLQGASVQGSDLRDVLRNIPEDQQKMGMIPMAPSGAGGNLLETWMGVAARKGLTQEQAMKGAQIVMDDAEYYNRVGFNGVLNLLEGPAKSGLGSTMTYGSKGQLVNKTRF